MTFVSENHECVVVHCGTNYPSSGSDAESNETRCVRLAHSDTKTMPRIKPTWYGGEAEGKRNSCRGVRWSLQGSEWKSNSKHVDDVRRLWRLKLKSNTPTLVTKATGRRRDIDETLMQHDVRASREAAGTSSPAVKSSIQKGTWLYRRQADPKALRACQKTLWAAEDLTKEIVLSTVGGQACCDARPSRIRLTHRKSESHGTVRRLLEKASSWRVQVASFGSTQESASERVRVAPPRSEQWRVRVPPPELMGGSSITVLTTKQTSQILEQIETGAEARTTSGNSAICKTCEGKQIESVAKPDDRRIDPGGTPQERNPAEVRGQDLEQDTETEAHTSESLTMWLRQMQQRQKEGQRKALTCLTQNKSERKTPCEPRRGWRRLRRMQ